VAINPPSDIVLDVAKAADPVKSLVAAERLTRLAGGDAAAADFSDLVHSMRTPSADASGMRTQMAIANVGRGMLPSAKVDAKAAAAYRNVEAFFLKDMIESIMPKNANSVFGKGTAGDMWKSMLAEQIANQVAKTSPLGIAKMIAAAHPPGVKKDTQTFNAAAAAAQATTKPEAVAAPSVQEPTAQESSVKEPVAQDADSTAKASS
jgi:Rod binding domain-containing protein